jgi:hypothetical protein
MAKCLVAHWQKRGGGNSDARDSGSKGMRRRTCGGEQKSGFAGVS